MAELRAALDLTQPKAARLLGVGKRTVQGWEARGTWLPDAYAYVGLAFSIHGDKMAAFLLEKIPDVEGAAVRRRTA